MSNTHEGVILEIRETKQITDKFQKREFVVDQVFVGNHGESHSIGVFSLVQEKCGLIDQFKVGDNIIVHFDLDFRAWIDRDTKEHRLDKDGEKAYFADVKAWKLEPGVAKNTTTQAPAADDPQDTTPAPGANDFNPNPPVGDKGPDDLPF